MQITRIFSTLALGAAWIHTAAADADFQQVRRKLAIDHTDRKPDQPEKYFHESTFSLHYDGRFADKALPYEQQKKTLRSLVQAYLTTFSDLGVETWLMHGSLLGWWWGQKTLPWDNDLDVQVSEPSIHYLANYHNMSTFFYRTTAFPEGRHYLLEVNPHFSNREQTDVLNLIDARWIDMDSGMFIDITAVRYNMTHPEGEGMLSCKDGHEFRDTYLYPLWSTYFEGVKVKIPYKYEDMLESEYGAQAMNNKLYHNHVFKDDVMEWLPRYPGGGDGPLEL